MGNSLEQKPNVLLLGGSGLLGLAMRDAKLAINISTTHCSHPSPESRFFDARSSKISTVLADMRAVPGAAVIMLGVTSIDTCARDPDATAVVNVHGIISVIDQLRAHNIFPVFVSSDAVFDGNHGNYSETFQPRPILTYGQQKVKVERYLRSSGSPHLILRLPKILSVSYDPRCLVSRWVDALRRGEKIQCATDQYFTPAGSSDIAQAIASLILAREEGVFHLGGPTRLSRRDLLEMVLVEFRKHSEPIENIEECSLRDIPALEPRPKDTSLDSGKFRHKIETPFSPTQSVVGQAVLAGLRYFSVAK